MFRIQLTLVICMVLGWIAPVHAGPGGGADASQMPMWSQADALRSFYAIGKIHQVIAAGSHVWLIADNNPETTDNGPWLIRTDAKGEMQAGIPMHQIPGLDTATHWPHVPLAATRTGVLGMLVHDRKKSLTLLEFNVELRLIRHNHLDHLPESMGGLLGLEFDEDHRLIVASQQLVRLDDDLQVVNSWSTDNAEFIVAYTVDRPAHIAVVLVTDDNPGFRWITRQLDSSSLRASTPITIAKTAARHFLVDVFVPDTKHTVVVMPDIDGTAGVWRLITMNDTEQLSSVAVSIPQNTRKTHETKVLQERSHLHFLSIDARQAWHTVVPLDKPERSNSQVLKIPQTEFESAVTNVYGDHTENRLYVGTNYRMATGSQPIDAAALLLLEK